MPADIEQMFSVREVPWHREGQVLDDYPQTWEEARTLAGLDWEPVALPAVEWTRSPEQVRELVLAKVRDSAFHSIEDNAAAVMKVLEESMRSDRDFRRIARSDTMKTLSYQRDSYNIIPNAAFGMIIDAILERKAGMPMVRLVTGGCLADGRKIWMLVQLDEPVRLPGDGSYTFPYLGLTSSHDGTASCAARLTTVRIVCANTFGAAEAEGERTGAVYSFSHRSDWRGRLDEARETLMYARQQTAEYVAAMTELTGIKITGEQEKLFLQLFVPAPPDGLVSDRVAGNIDQARAAVLAILASPTVEGAGIRGTAYGLVQAAGEYLDHVRVSRSWESRMNRSLLRPEPLKAKAARLAREVALADA